MAAVMFAGTSDDDVIRSLQPSDSSSGKSDLSAEIRAESGGRHGERRYSSTCSYF